MSNSREKIGKDKTTGRIKAPRLENRFSAIKASLRSEAYSMMECDTSICTC